MHNHSRNFVTKISRLLFLLFTLYSLLPILSACPSSNLFEAAMPKKDLREMETAYNELVAALTSGK